MDAAAAAVDLCSVLLLGIAAAGWWVGVRDKDCCWQRIVRRLPAAASPDVVIA